MLEVCPGENYTLSCKENETSYIIWNWNDVSMRDYTAGQGINYSINTIDPLLIKNNMMESTRLISNFSDVYSELEFTLFENVTSVNVWCNRVMIIIKNRVRVHYFHFLLYSGLNTIMVRVS